MELIMRCINFPPEEKFETLCIPHVFGEIYIDDVYKIVKENHFNTILDLGAHIGIVSMFFAQHCKQVYSFEPLESHFKCFQKNIETNGIANIEAFNVAISNKVGKANFSYNQWNTTCCCLSEAGGKVVDTTTIEKFLDDKKINEVDYLKMDIEGGEANVILDESFDRVAPKIKMLFLASHGFREIEMFDKLRSLGYSGIHLPSGETINLFWR
jgi:FkbM family methyltransferase